MSSRERGLLFTLWLLATALNVAKPYHIDDTFYLEQARWIAAHPDRPTSGLVFWEGEAPAPFHRVGNHAPLVPALQAMVIAAFGDSSIALHLLTSVFTAIAILLLHTLAKRHAPRPDDETVPLVVTALVILSPAFVAEQNVMLDVPLLCAWLAFFVALDHMPRPSACLAAGAALALALLVKLGSVVLFVTLVIEAVRAWRARSISPVVVALSLAIPIGALGLWALASLEEVGEISFLSRGLDALSPTVDRSMLESAGIGLGRSGLFVIVLGGIAPALAVLLPFHLLSARGPRALALACGAIVVLSIGARLAVSSVAHAHHLDALADEPLAHAVLRVIDLVLGAGMLALALSRARSGDAIDRRLALWLGVGACAAIGLAPFLAARHVLLVLAPAWLLLARAELLVVPRVRTAALVLGSAIGIAAAIADHRMATVYAEQAPRLHDQARRGAPTGRVYAVGHWGWQEHARAAGLDTYLPGTTDLAIGDVLIEPEGVHAQRILEADRARLEALDTLDVDAGPLDLVRTLVDREGLYVSWLGLPWSLRTDRVERFVVHSVAR
ncbi:MAG: glycosyltransferase family 39 protein [Deltaproteobacteria bacterium]|nr:glycosyltransferase family 39 protein [Deltaproteobacteria bacterium]